MLSNPGFSTLSFPALRDVNRDVSGWRRVCCGCGGQGRGFLQRRLDDFQSFDGAIAEIAVDAVHDFGGFVFDVERAGRIDAQDECAAGPGIASIRQSFARGIRARPFEPFGLGVFGDVGTDDAGPIGHDLGRVEAEFLKCLGGNLGHEAAGRTHIAIGLAPLVGRQLARGLSGGLAKFSCQHVSLRHSL